MTRRRARRSRTGALTYCLGTAAVCLGLTGALVGVEPAAAASPAASPAGFAASGPSLTVSAADLVERSTGQRLFAIDPNRELPIASTTKLMTVLLTLEHVRLGRTFAAPAYYPSPAESQIGLAPGERMSVHDLLLAVLLPSANDAAVDLAYNVGHGSITRFVSMMNVRAGQLRLTRTHYSTPVGLDAADNYSSASDLITLASVLLARYPFFARAVALPTAVLRTGSHVRSVVNRDDLLGKVPWINGVKSGHTIQAGYVLVGSGTWGGMTLLSAVLGTSSAAARDSNTLALLGFGFSHFRLATPVRAGEVLARPAVVGRPGRRAAVIAASTFSRVIQRGAHLTLRIQAPSQLAGPLRRHAIVGRVLVLAGGRTVARIRLRLARALPALAALPAASDFITRPSTVVSIVVLFGAAMALAVRRRLRTQATRSRGAELA